MMIPSPVGPLHLAADGDSLAMCSFTEVPGEPAPILDEAARQLAAYFAGKLRAFTLPLAPAGTAFQRKVWTALAAIPFGVKRSYQDIARAIGQPSAVRAVGMANGANPIAIIIPCHRVIGADGSLTGYGGGLPRKKWLLGHESGDLFGAQPGAQELDLVADQRHDRRELP
jgi:methylated-DNA-[protein]-cysteine S-methyltransferase